MQREFPVFCLSLKIRKQGMFFIFLLVPCCYLFVVHLWHSAEKWQTCRFFLPIPVLRSGLRFRLAWLFLCGRRMIRGCWLLKSAFQSSRSPFVGKLLSDFNGFQSLVYPIVGISECFIFHHGAVNGKFWVLDLVQTLFGYLRHPELEGFCFGGGNGLD